MNDVSEKHLLEKVEDGVAVLTMNRPESLNALSPLMMGALREAVSRGNVGADDRVVVLVTGDGLKTPGPIADRLQPVRIEADADALIDRLAAA